MNKFSDIAQSLTLLIDSKRYICPQPQIWQAMWELLPTQIQDKQIIKPPAPLILAGWNFSEDSQKKDYKNKSEFLTQEKINKLLKIPNWIWGGIQKEKTSSELNI